VRRAAALRVHHFDLEGIRVGIAVGVEAKARRERVGSRGAALGGDVVAYVQRGQRVVVGKRFAGRTVDKPDGYWGRVDGLEIVSGIGASGLLAGIGIRDRDRIPGLQRPVEKGAVGGIVAQNLAVLEAGCHGQCAKCVSGAGDHYGGQG